MVDTVKNYHGMKNLNFLYNYNTVVVLAAFWVNFCLLGVQRSNAVIFRAFVDIFEVNRQHAAWPSGIFGFFMCITGAVSGFLNQYVSIRVLAVIGAALASASVSICSLASEMPHVVLLYGAFQGIGMGLIVPLTHVVLNQNVTKYRACALGIAFSGSSAGSFIFPPLTNILLTEYGLQGTLLLLGGIMFNSLIGAFLFKVPKQFAKHKLRYKSLQFERDKMLESPLYEKEKCEKLPAVKYISNEQSPAVATLQPSIIKGSSKNLPTKNTLQITFEILSNPSFIIISFAYAVYFSISSIFLMVAVDFAKDKNMNPEKGVFLVSAFSFGDFVGRLTFGWIADIKCISRNILVRLYLLSMGILTFLLPIFPTEALPAACVLLGLINGSIIINHSVLLTEYLGIQNLPIAMGFSTCFIGISAFLRPLVIGAFRDQNENYNKVFHFMGLLQICVTFLWFLEYFLHFIRSKYVKTNVLESSVK